MGSNYIVQRQTPDWLTFDLEQSRPFLRGAGLNEDLVIDFARIWDKEFRVGYREWRDRVKQISLMNYRSVGSASLMSRAEFDRISISPDDLILFIDDDDWLRDDLFEDLRGRQVNGHGARWGSIRVGLVGDPKSFDPDPTEIALRPMSEVLFTNNYVVTGALLKAVGVDPVFQHTSAQGGVAAGKFRPVPIASYLSAANKHLCSTMSARSLLASEGFRNDARKTVGAILERMHASSVPEPAAWIRPILSQYLDLCADALR